jgi:transcriptional regulator with XRE-family HTH domain
MRAVDQAIGRILRSCREKNGLSQKTVAWRAGVSRSYVGKLERATLSATIFQVHLVLSTLGVTFQSFGVMLDKEFQMLDAAQDLVAPGLGPHRRWAPAGSGNDGLVDRTRTLNQRSEGRGRKPSAARRQSAAKVVARAFRAFRESASVSQERLAALAGVARTYVGRVERAALMPTMTQMHRLLAALGVSWQAFGAGLDTELNAAQRADRPLRARSARRPRDHVSATKKRASAPNDGTPLATRGERRPAARRARMPPGE